MRAFNVVCTEQDGYEADDLIATYARQAMEAGADVTIVSSDKDLMQLIRPGISMLDTMKNKAIGPDEVMEKLGVPPEKVIDVQALCGDSVDNVPGVPGIGVKTAAELITAYGDLDTLLAKAGEIKQPKRRERLLEFADQARISKQLVTLKTDVDVQCPLDSMGVRAPQPDALLGFLRLMEFSTLTLRIAETLGVDAPAGTSEAKPRRQCWNRRRGSSQPHPGHPHGRRGRQRQCVPVIERHRANMRWRHRRRSICKVGPRRPKPLRDRDRSRRPRSLDRGGACYRAGRLRHRDHRPRRHAADLVGISLATAPGRACYCTLGHRSASGAFDFGDGGIVQVPVAAGLAALKLCSKTKPS